MKSKPYKYVTHKGYYKGCPGHDDVDQDKELMFFRTVKEFFRYLIDECKEYRYSSLYSCNTGSEVVYLDYCFHKSHIEHIEIKFRKKYYLISTHPTVTWTRK